MSWTHHDAKLGEALVELLESRKERLLQGRTLRGERLEHLSV